MYHSLLIHSSANGHLGCVHGLAIVNSVVAKFFGKISLCRYTQFIHSPTEERFDSLRVLCRILHRKSFIRYVFFKRFFFSVCGLCILTVYFAEKLAKEN